MAARGEKREAKAERFQTQQKEGNAFAIVLGAPSNDSRGKKIGRLQANGVGSTIDKGNSRRQLEVVDLFQRLKGPRVEPILPRSLGYRAFCSYCLFFCSSRTIFAACTMFVSVALTSSHPRVLSPQSGSIHN